MLESVHWRSAAVAAVAAATATQEQLVKRRLDYYIRFIEQKFSRKMAHPMVLFFAMMPVLIASYLLYKNYEKTNQRFVNNTGHRTRSRTEEPNSRHQASSRRDALLCRDSEECKCCNNCKVSLSEIFAVQLFPCKHMFCHTCMQHWIENNENRQIDYCPNCNRYIRYKNMMNED